MKSSPDDLMKEYEALFEWRSPHYQNSQFCGCVVTTLNGTESLVDCDNCDGYGIAPIPWRDLNGQS